MRTLASEPALWRLLEDLVDGADIYDLRAALFLRECERARLVRIVPAMKRAPGQERQPYFGAVLGPKGAELIRNRRERAIRRGKEADHVALR